jgi:hypothetical protein
MKLRRLCACTILFGWYLMIPPADPRAPLSQWTRAATYNTAGECKAKRYEDISQAVKKENISQAAKVREADAIQRARNSKCVPSQALK